jgi:hypothetical protein
VALSDESPEALRSRAVIKDMMGDLKGSNEDIMLAEAHEVKHAKTIEEHNKWKYKARSEG